MEIGVVVHGPGIIDSGWAMKIIDYLSNYGNVRCRLGGTMGRTAVIDAGLENIINISMKLLPSESLEIFNTENVDVIFLLDYGKSQETGHVFGYTAFNHYFKKISNEDYLSTNHKSFYDSDIPVVQIERPGEEDGSIISWNVDVNRKIKQKKKGLFSRSDDSDEESFDFVGMFNDLIEEFNLTKHTPEDVLNNYFSEISQAADEETVRERIADFPDDGSQFTYRRIHGASPGENILVNGFVIGYSESDAPILLARDDIIVDIIGGVVKEHGVEKLGPVNLSNAIVKTGLLRKSKEVIPRVLDSDFVSINDVEMNSSSNGLENKENSFKIAYVDHAAYDIYRFKNFDLVVTVGDDTTLVASDILYRFDIPIIGITDGDLDKVVEKGFVNDKSIILEVAPDFDDIVGHNIHERLFSSNSVLEIPYEEDFNNVDDFKKASFDVFQSHVEDVVKSVVPSFIFKKGADLEETLVTSNLDDSLGAEETYVDEFDDGLDEFIDNFDEGRHEEQFEEEIPHEVYVEDVPQDDFIDEEFMGEEVPHEVFVEDVPADEFVENQDYVDESIEDLEDPAYYDELADDVEPVEDLEDPAYYEELEESGEDLEDPAYYEELYVEEDPDAVYVDDNSGAVYVEQESVYGESELPHEVFIENSPDEVYVESEPVEEIFVEEHGIEDDYSHDDFVDDFFAELPPESIEEVFIDPDPMEEDSIASEQFAYESSDNGESYIDYEGSDVGKGPEFDDGLDYEAVSLPNASEESSNKSKDEDFDDDGIIYEKASFVESDDDLEDGENN
ncbi:MAG: DUF2117 domain-containing protein [Methanobrevibacter sp.]|nr:DUF2117 domain-containing protein [Methanobrevibacter sp.]